MIKFIIVIYVLFFNVIINCQTHHSLSNSVSNIDDSTDDQELYVEDSNSNDLNSDSNNLDNSNNNNNDNNEELLNSNSDNHQHLSSSSSSSSSNNDDILNDKKNLDSRLQHQSPTENIEKLIENKTPEEIILTLKNLVKNGNQDAKLKLAIAYFYGNPFLDLNTAYEYFQELSSKGNSIAHLYLGFMYAIGLPPVKANQAKALLYYTFASIANHTYARMALGYRYWSGISVASNCQFALSYYRKVAKVVEQSYTFANNPSIQRIRILDEIENSGSYPGTIDDDLIQYYQFLADKGDINAQVGLGQLHFQGARGVAQNQNRAFHYFTMAAESGNTNAMAYLGKMYLEGNKVVEQNYEKAYEYFKMAADKDNPIGQSGLGIMYLYGRGRNKDFKEALRKFLDASMQGWVDGQLYLGIMYLNGYGVSKDYKRAIEYFKMALQSGHIIAFYHLAEMQATGTGTLQSCSSAVELFKSVCERGDWGTLIMEAHNDYKEGRYSNAFIKYAVLSELGYEVAQSNAAFMLDRSEVGDLFDKNEIYSRAFMYWSRSASQGYSIARVKLGDYHYYGLGTKVDYEMAANQYRIASDFQNNAQASFNLGYMYETGLGMKRDIYLAKRYYDLAAVTSTDAQVPVALALTKLFFIYFYDHIKNIGIKNLWLLPMDFGTNIIDNYLGQDWDLYFATIIALILATLFFMRRHVAAAGG